MVRPSAGRRNLEVRSDVALVEFPRLVYFDCLAGHDLLPPDVFAFKVHETFRQASVDLIWSLRAGFSSGKCFLSVAGLDSV